MALLVSLPLYGGGRPALGSEARLPFTTFFELYVDQPRRHVLVSGGSGTDGVLVFGFDGRLIRRIGDLPGASDMLVEGDRMYVALANSNAIAIVDLAEMEVVDRIDVSPYGKPLYLSKSRETIYFTHSCDAIFHSGFASVDVVGRVVVDHEPPLPAACAEHAVVPSDPNTLFAWDSMHTSPIVRFNVTARHPVRVDESEDGFYGSVQFSADGETFYAPRSTYDVDAGIEQRRIADFSFVRNYPGAARGFAWTPDERFLFSSTTHYDTDVHAYAQGRAAPVARLDLDDTDGDSGFTDVVGDSLGAAPEGDRVFAVVRESRYDGDTLAFRVLWPQYRVAGGRGDQSTPAGSGPYVVWSQGGIGGSRLSPLVARAKGRTFRVSPPRTSGYAGGIEGTKLVYQQVRGRQSDVRLYDLARRRQTSSLDRLNTRGWEWHPTISRGRILFSRALGRRDSVVLFDLKSGRERKLVTVLRRRAFTQSGQVNGSFAVYSVCARVCDTYRVNLATGGRVKVNRPARRSNYAASVTRRGVVYYAQSGIGCGTEVEILRYANGRVTQVQDLRVGDDVFYTYADDGAGRVLFDYVTCSTDAWDVLSFRDSAVSGDGGGPPAEPPAPIPGELPLPGGIWFEDLGPAPD